MADNNVNVCDGGERQFGENISKTISENDYEPGCLKHIIRTDPNLLKEFEEIIGDCEKTWIIQHEKANVRPNSEYDIFYRYFFSKYVSIIQGKDAKSGMLEKHASIFPFKTNPNLQISRIPVAELFDDRFLKEVQNFVKYHFSKDIDLEYLKNLFLANIDHFKRQHFNNPPSLGQMTRIITIGSNAWRRDSPPQYLSNYLNNFIRLNDAGAEWYKYFQTKFNDVCKLYNKESLMLPEKSESYFKYLPEINCCELLLLLEIDFYQLNRQKYIYLFRKYLFFFGNAIERADPHHPVFFIDETLFCCLQFKKKYEIFRGSILKLQWELWMVTLVHRRRFPHPYNPELNVRLDENNLNNVIKYANQIPGIESAFVYYEEPQNPRFKIFLLLDDVVFLMGYSNRINSSNFGQIIKSALLSREIKKIVYYNAYLGQVTSLDMPSRKNEILNFIRKYNKSSPMYPEKFLIHHCLKQYFVNLPDSDS